MATVLDQLKCIVNSVDDGCCSPGCAPCCPTVGCPPCPYPYLQVYMLTPPCCEAPTEPKYVKPLQLSSPPTSSKKKRDPEEEFRNRTAHFYNNYNIDYHNPGGFEGASCGSPKLKKPKHAVCVDGQRPRCQDYMKRNEECDQAAGCPTGYKPCQMKLCQPPGCDPLGTWKATVQPCPPKPKKRVSNQYVPEECTRPCCKHWKPKGGFCLYDKPCKAHCYDHPPGIKPAGQC